MKWLWCIQNLKIIWITNSINTNNCTVLCIVYHTNEFAPTCFTEICRSKFISIIHNTYNTAFVGADRLCNSVQSVWNEQCEIEKKYIFYLIFGSVDESYTGKPFTNILTSFLKPWHEPCRWCFLWPVWETPSKRHHHQNEPLTSNQDH